MSENRLEQRITAVELLGMHQLAAENGDGFAPGFLEMLARAKVLERPPRLVVNNSFKTVDKPKLTRSQTTSEAPDLTSGNIEQQAFLAEQGFDRHEKAVLQIARLYFLAYCDPTKLHWQSAMEACVSAFGARVGPGIAYGIMTMLRHMSEARKSVFSFTNPCCEKCAARLTNCERLLVGTVHSMRRGDSMRARMNGLILCEGHETAAFLKAVDALCQRLIEVEN